jgi:hypothetical protein
MNPGPTEEAGQTARSVVDALRTQPLILVLLLINILFVAMLWFGLHEQSLRKDALILKLTEYLAACPAAVLPHKE